MVSKLKSIINDLNNGLFGKNNNTSLVISYNDNCKLYYKNELNKIPKTLLEKSIIRKNLMGNIYYVTIK